MGLIDDIKSGAIDAAASIKKGKAAKEKPTERTDDLIDTSEAMIIEHQLNKLFYLQPNYDEEIAMLKLQAKLKSEDRYGLHASAILESENEFCYREQVLSLFYKQLQGENIPIGLKRIYEEGNFIGEKWQRLFIRGGVGKKEDMDISRFNAKYDLSYTPDAAIFLAIFGGKKYLVETKSQNTFIFKKQKSHPKGVKQLKFYMFLEGIHDGFCLVEDKNDQNFKVLLVKYDEAELEPYIERLEMIQIYKQEFLQQRKMVDRHKACTSAICKKAAECNMRDACWNVGMGRVKL